MLHSRRASGCRAAAFQGHAVWGARQLVVVCYAAADCDAGCGRSVDIYRIGAACPDGRAAYEHVSVVSFCGDAYKLVSGRVCYCYLRMEPSEKHRENHKAYVQAWIKGISEKPETLMHAIKDAQAAANYMDWKAGLITAKEYVDTCRSVIEVKPKVQSRER